MKSENGQLDRESTELKGTRKRCTGIARTRVKNRRWLEYGQRVDVPRREKSVEGAEDAAGREWCGQVRGDNEGAHERRGNINLE